MPWQTAVFDMQPSLRLLHFHDRPSQPNGVAGWSRFRCSYQCIRSQAKDTSLAGGGVEPQMKKLSNIRDGAYDVSPFYLLTISYKLIKIFIHAILRLLVIQGVHEVLDALQTQKAWYIWQSVFFSSDRAPQRCCVWPILSFCFVFGRVKQRLIDNGITPHHTFNFGLFRSCYWNERGLSGKSLHSVYLHKQSGEMLFHLKIPLCYGRR